MRQVLPYGALRIVARSDVRRDDDGEGYLVGVSVPDGEGGLLFSERSRVEFTPIWAPGCRSFVDPAYCGSARLDLTRGSAP